MFWEIHTDFHSVQIAGEAERDIGARVADPGYKNAAICSFTAEQGTRLLKLPVP